MWTIGQIKARGKVCFQRNYWKAVLVALVISMIGGMQGSNAVKAVFSLCLRPVVNMGMSSDSHPDGIRSPEHYSFNSPQDNYSDPFSGSFGNDIGDDFEFYVEKENPFSFGNSFGQRNNGLSGMELGVIVLLVMLLVFIAAVVMIVSLLIDIFFRNPLFVGTQRFFIHNLTADGMVGDMGFGFDRCYRNQVKIMFCRDLYTFGWSLLFLIPGIYKSYEYRMVPYLMAEYPQMDKDQVFYTSKHLMKGNKAKALLFDLSFIGWWILSLMTCGIVGVFFVNPYYVSSCAALYEALKAIRGIPAYYNDAAQRPDYAAQGTSEELKADANSMEQKAADPLFETETVNETVNETVIETVDETVNETVSGPGFVMSDTPRQQEPDNSDNENQRT